MLSFTSAGSLEISDILIMANALLKIHLELTKCWTNFTGPAVLTPYISRPVSQSLTCTVITNYIGIVLLRIKAG